MSALSSLLIVALVICFTATAKPVRRHPDDAANFPKVERISCFDDDFETADETHKELLAELMAEQERVDAAAHLKQQQQQVTETGTNNNNNNRAEYMIPMRDGVRLFTVIELPDEAANGTVGLILKRTPYGQLSLPARYLQMGFAVAGQDMRGCHGSEGTFEMWRTCGQDGYDTLAWIANQSWSNGNVFVIGSSADAIAALTLVTSGPPQLKSIFETVGAIDGHSTAFYSGTYRTELLDGWLAVINPGTIQDVHEHEAEGEWWDPLRGSDFFHNIVFPTVNYGGWYDIFQEGTTDAFLAGQYLSPPSSRGSHFLIVSPNGHCANTYHPNTSISLPSDLSDELFLQENSNGAYESPLVRDTPAITYYLMGADERLAVGNYWVQTEAWPTPTNRPYYLQTNGGLTTTAPVGGTGSRAFQFDPSDPVPTIGGANLFAGCGPQNQAPADARPDVLTFTSAVLTAPLAIVGNVTAVLYVSTTGADSDFTVKLSDVYSDGRALLIADGVARLKWRLSNEVPSNPTPGVTYRLELSLWKTAFVFDAGHAIRVSVSSSNDPRFRVNPNNGLLIVDEDSQPERIVTNTVQINNASPSHIILPVVPLESVPRSEAMDQFILN